MGAAAAGAEAGGAAYRSPVFAVAAGSGALGSGFEGGGIGERGGAALAVPEADAVLRENGSPAGDAGVGCPAIGVSAAA